MYTILYAEDNDSNYLLMSFILKDGYKLLRAGNGKEAVEMVNTGNVDLILMDIKMPVMDGLQATGLIRETNPDIPIIAVTANGYETDNDTVIAAGCSEFISKPVFPNVIRACIKKYLP